MAFPKIDGYVVTEKLGSGSYSTVYKAHTKVGARMTVAIKCVDKSRIKNSGTAVDNLITEIRLLKTLTHPHIVRMHNFTWDDRNIYIIMEYCCGGDLSKYIRRAGRVPECQVHYFLQQLASALKFLYEKGVMHMDLKPHNLLLDKDATNKYILKVADFGFAQHMSAEWTRSVRGSPLYMAPEMLAGDYGPSADLWSVGVIVYECLFGRAPYSSNTFKELVNKIQSQAPIQIPPAGCGAPSAGCARLLTRLLRPSPTERITHEEFFKDEYLDLEHMPSPENYQQAVGLIRRAVDLDRAGAARGALAAYTRALRLLVPRLRAETDRVARAALRGKLDRYMERAEEIKQFLKEEPPAHAHHSHTQHETEECTPPSPAPCAVGPASEGPPVVDPTSETRVPPVLGQPHEALPNNAVPCDAGEHSPRAVRVRSPRFALGRLFARKHSLPYLDSKDADISSAAPRERDGNDTCRIT